MSDSADNLIPPVAVISRRLTEIAREQRDLRLLFKIAVRAREEREQGRSPSAPGSRADTTTPTR